MPKPPPDKDRVARILSDAKVYGDADTCKRHGISAKTLQRYKKLSDKDHVVSEKVQALQRPHDEAVVAQHRTWLEKAGEARDKLLERMMTLAASCDNLHAVTGAFKIVNDGILAEQVVGEGQPEDDDGGRAGSGFGLAGAGSSATQAQRAVDKLSH